MSRFLFAAMGSLGDLHPYLAVARALITRGHQTVVAAAEEYRVPVQGAGVEFAPARPSLAELGDYQTAVASIFDVRRGPERLIRRLVMPHLRAAYEDIMRASDGADFLVSHPLTLTVQLVAQRRGLPWAATVLSPMSFMSCCDPPLLAAAPWLRKVRALGPTPYRWLFGLLKQVAGTWEKPLREFRKELGLPASKQLAMFEGQFSPLLNLALFDPQLAQPQPDWPRNTHVCGSAVFDGAVRDAGALNDLDRFLAAGDAPIVFALGSSAVWVAGDFWERAAAAARELGRRAILITGPTTPGSLPEGIKAFSYLPYSKVLPRAAAVVHQAGTGTLAQALRAGRPQLMVPLAFDQPDNAQRAQALGAGRGVPFRRATAQRLVSELELLLSRPGYGKAARAVADELARIDGAGFAAERLINCLKAPVNPTAA